MKSWLLNCVIFFTSSIVKGDPLEIASEPSEHLEELEFGFEALEMEPSFTRDSINALVRYKNLLELIYCGFFGTPKFKSKIVSLH